MSNLVKNWIINSKTVTKYLELEKKVWYAKGLGDGLNKGYQKGFNDGLEYEGFFEDLEMEIEETPDDKLPGQQSYRVSQSVSADEEREMLREALANFA